ncbi:MAG: hypothetical protein K2X81_22440, partial [Candidatus Obscuribacterales bacterium]|nr:hypothetical protein [Candidatus Obscuribacterales bacterium]
MSEIFARDAHAGKTPAVSQENDALINRLAQESLTKSDLLSNTAAPNSLAYRYGIVTAKGIGNIPAGMLHAAEEDIKHPLQTLEMIGSAALMGAALKVVLPEAGPAGKIAGAAIGAYFTYKAATPFVDAYKHATYAKTMGDLDLAARHIGDAGGSFIVNSAVSGLGYKLGSAGAERVLMSQSMDGFANVKQQFWDGVSNKAGQLSDALGITTSAEPTIQGASSTASLRPLKAGEVQKFAPSNRLEPQGVLKGEVPSNEAMDITIQLKSKGTDLEMERALKRIALGRQNPMTDGEFADKFGSTQESLNEVSSFAKEHGLKVSEADLRSGRVVLSGTAGDFSSAFQTKIKEYDINGSLVRGREGALT